ncbi:MAG TPA: serine hydrolase domain-containing protein [Steroidobacteraceae bacterium]|nr:serine hydrolase domain-containing protein [Steroidobacteraceae bacterium]
MRFNPVATLLASALLAQTGAAGAATDSPAPATEASTAHTLPAADTAHTLDAADVNAWLDGFMPYALATGDIAGAVVMVVKDGQVVTGRGFGYADVDAQKPVTPDGTLFRPGSVSKLLTWTAVMQQVEAGKLNLDADVNTYLDFQIPPRDGQPVTLRNLMTHTPGFEETAKHLFVQDASQIPTLGDTLKRWVPERMYPPGKVPAYSNYGAALAGYIVERVSGEPFDKYIEHHILQPLGMEHSTFTQPLPKDLEAGMSKGYPRASEPAKPYELVGPAPAGSLAATGADMARFMIAHLQDGQLGSARILSAQTARLMHTQANMPTPPFPGMALGFYRDDRNGHVVIAHGGDTEVFHSDLHLFLDDGVGLYISMNSLGKEAAAAGLRNLLFQEFADRYFPAPRTDKLPTLPTARADAARVAGNYWASRRSDSNFLRIASLAGQLRVAALPDGTLSTPLVSTPGGAGRKWREVGPNLWEQVGGRTLLRFHVVDGQVEHFTMDEVPAIEIFQKVPTAFNARWNVPLFMFSAAVLLITVLMWPTAALVRRHYGRAFPLQGRAASFSRALKWIALVDLLVIGGWLAVLSLLAGHIALLNDPLNPWLHLLHLLGVIALLGAIVGILNAVHVWRDARRGWWSRAGSVLVAVACLDVAWLILLLRLLGPSTNF